MTAPIFFRGSLMSIYEINFMACHVISAISFGSPSPLKQKSPSSALPYLRSFSIGVS